uniref:Uncharacterized protein n=1 Tax=Candidatus Kentrum sp. MB TaxID=2138164 RepID=A0A451BG14_9GAMM|nr:MAG: hypothetical protein BECKMB1821H_GA0114242_11114 [Candidatus Kentron sp. MB]
MTNLGRHKNWYNREYPGPNKVFFRLDRLALTIEGKETVSKRPLGIFEMEHVLSQIHVGINQKKLCQKISFGCDCHKMRDKSKGTRSLAWLRDDKNSLNCHFERNEKSYTRFVVPKRGIFHLRRRRGPRAPT